MDRALLAVSRRQFAPLGPGPQDPKDALEALAVVGPRPAAFQVGFADGEVLAHLVPLLVGQSSPGHESSPCGAGNPRRGMGSYYLSQGYWMTSRHLFLGSEERWLG